MFYFSHNLNLHNWNELTDHTVCHCGKKETMEHIYNCNYLNEGNLLNIKYEKIFNGSLKDQIKILEKIQENLEKREKVKEIKKIKENPM